jgi:imidazolonepropionase-like amidohydrolase
MVPVSVNFDPLTGLDFLGLTDKVGTIAPGHEADVLLSRNPLLTVENSRSLVAVIADGRLVEGVVSESP